MKADASTSSNELADIVLAGGARSRTRSRIIWAIVIAAAAAGGWLWWSQSQNSNGKGLTYATAPVERGSVALSVVATGNLEPTNEVTVGSELSGIIVEVFVDTNDRVTKGQPLARLDTSKLTQQTESSRARANSAKAKVDQAEATKKEALATLARRQELFKLTNGEVPSKAEMDTAAATAERAQADVDSAKASVGEAEAQVKINENDLSKAMIKSPIDGLVLKRDVEPGQTVAASFTAPELFVIAENLEHMKLKVAVQEADIGRLKKDQEATFTVDAWPGRTFNAAVSRVAYGSLVTDNVVTYETELEVANQDLSLRPGMTATAEIRAAESTGVLLVPTAALRFDPAAAAAGPGGQGATFMQTLMPGPGRGRRGGGGGRGPGGGQQQKDDAAPTGTPGTGKVWVLLEGKPAPISVTTGISDSRHTEISGEGVKEGLEVITRAVPPPP